MEKIFALFGKFVLVVALLGAVSYSAYRFGKTTAPAKESGAAVTTAAPTNDPGLKPESLPEGYVPSKTVTAGLDTTSGLSFTKYVMIVPGDWTADHTTTNEGTWVDTLILTKGQYQIKIFQAATGGAICLYPSDTPMEGPSSTFDTYVDITTTDGLALRRSTTKTSSKGFTVCQKSETYENFQQPTIFGHISIKTPSSPDAETLSQIDMMISSLKKL